MSMFHLTQAPLSELREHEWLWRSPKSQLPSRQWWLRVLDPLCFRVFSRSDLLKAKRHPAPQEEEYYFAWVCSAIEINRRFSEAYVWRALSGNELFCRRGRIRRLQGWDRTGAERYYDADCAVLDVLVATALQPQWDWALCASGVMGFVKAIRLRNKPVPGEDPLAWSGFARARLSLAARLAARRNHPVELRKSERLISDIDYWAEHGIVPTGSDVEWLDAD